MDYVKNEFAGPWWDEADVAMAIAVRSGRLRPGAETLAEVIFATADLDYAQPVDVTRQPIFARFAKGCPQLRCEGRPRSSQERRRI
ncbi:hypothetical protein [Virgisporangium aurantiacum]|uniref:Uncharacterized protein n=1 Tax=Virgisporangium aurantiacum TaxID=175570 RepID=A0A8J3ZKS7_9ACTN|nr:hypothetical protein [Virgisporangium aurantiacum]GIJ63780.1 hypothetical protein Vau01_112960 [Virgisporangium aurantiacum]